jgi:hypothetical protein
MPLGLPVVLSVVKIDRGIVIREIIDGRHVVGPGARAWRIILESVPRKADLASKGWQDGLSQC